MPHPVHISPAHARSGFTLIELSIVLVIIGLLVGGVLVAKDLIKAATIRAQVSQIDKYNQSVNTFEGKYNALPGDIPAAQAAAFGLFSTGMDGTTGKGDGNGLIQDRFGHSAPNTPTIFNEPLVFFRHLSDAKLIDGSFGTTLASGGTITSSQIVSQVNLWFPPAKIGRGNITVYSVNGQNYYQTYVPIAGPGMLPYSMSVDNQSWAWAPSVTPTEGQAIDTKMDDGMPTTGSVQAMSGSNSYNLGQPSVPSDHCTVAGSPATYDTGTTNGNSVNCDLSIRFQ